MIDTNYQQTVLVLGATTKELDQLQLPSAPVSFWIQPEKGGEYLAAVGSAFHMAKPVRVKLNIPVVGRIDIRVRAFYEDISSYQVQWNEVLNLRTFLQARIVELNDPITAFKYLGHTFSSPQGRNCSAQEATSVVARIAISVQSKVEHIIRSLGYIGLYPEPMQGSLPHEDYALFLTGSIESQQSKTYALQLMTQHSDQVLSLARTNKSYGVRVQRNRAKEFEQNTSIEETRTRTEVHTVRQLQSELEALKQKVEGINSKVEGHTQRLDDLGDYLSEKVTKTIKEALRENTKSSPWEDAIQEASKSAAEALSEAPKGSREIPKLPSFEPFPPLIFHAIADKNNQKEVRDTQEVSTTKANAEIVQHDGSNAAGAESASTILFGTLSEAEEPANPSPSTEHIQMLPLAKGMVDKLKGRLLGQGEKKSEEHTLPSALASSGSASSEAVAPAGDEVGAALKGEKSNPEEQKGAGSEVLSQKKIARTLN